MFILLGVYFALVELLGESSPWGGLLQAGFIVVFLGLFYLGKRVVQQLKIKHVVPRAGFVEYHVDKEDQTGKRMGSAALAAVLATLVIISIPLTGRLNWVVVLTGLLVGAMLVFAQARAGGIRRFYILGALSLLLGIAGGLTDFPDGYALGFYYGSMGLVFAVTGLLVWQRFLKENPILEEKADEA